jgi:hypothetical protein
MNTVRYSELLDHLSGLNYRAQGDGSNVKLTVALPLANDRFGVNQELEINIKVHGDLADIISVFLVSSSSRRKAGNDLITDWLGI